MARSKDRNRAFSHTVASEAVYFFSLCPYALVA